VIVPVGALQAAELLCDPRSTAYVTKRTGGTKANLDVLRTGNAVVWPPGHNEPCWCGSQRKYKKCCGPVPAANDNPQ
jgi:uncharacterized protein YecA (UPF0149 family)